MRKMFLEINRFLCLVLVLSSAFGSLAAQQLAFPEAEGFGRYATGGRGGTVYHVTNLDDSGPGSFRDAVSVSNRTVVFDVGGIIRISSRIVIKKNITVAGQTAPGQGITIYGNGIAFNGDSGNDIIRHIRFRMGYIGDSGKDAVGISEGQNYMFDHVSVTWGRDGTVDINGSTIDNITLQDCIVGQGLQTHSTGGLMQSGKNSVIRCLYTDNHTRNPKVKGVNEFINNVVYNWGVAGYIMGDTDGLSEANIMGNYFIAGPYTGSTAPFNRATTAFNAYVSQNWYDGNLNGKLDGADIPIPNYGPFTYHSTPYDYPGVNKLLTPIEAYNYVVANVGPSRSRDDVDNYLISELVSLGKIGLNIKHEYENPIDNIVGTVYGGIAPLDTDQDGMPDEWEVKNGLNKADASDRNGDLDKDGYTNLEEYLNELAGTSSVFLLPPSDLVAEVKAHNEISLKWSYPGELDLGYYLERSVNGGEFVKISDVSPTSTSYTDNSVVEKTTYVYRLQAFDSSTESAFANSNSVITFSADGTPFPATIASPTNGAVAIAPETAILKWNGGAQADYFNVYLGSSENDLALIGANVSNSIYDLPELNGNATYYWRIDAVNTSGTTTGDVWSFTTKYIYVPKEVAYYALDETTGTMAADGTAYKNNGTVTNIAEAWVAGKVNNGFNFSGGTTNSSIVIESQPQIVLDNTSFTVSFWVKAPAGTNGYLFNKGLFASADGGKWFGMESKGGASLYFSIDDDKTKTQLTMSNETFFTGSWVHIVAMRDKEEGLLKVYQNGALYKTVADGTGAIGNNQTMHIANCTLNDTNFPGVIDEFHLFNYAISDAEIAALAAEPVAGLPEAPTKIAPVSGAKLITPADLKFAWNSAKDATSYNLYFGTSADNLTLAKSGITDTSFVVPKLSGNAYYYWRVDAVNTSGTTIGSIWAFSTRALFENQLVAHYMLDETSGTDATDASTFVNTGAITNITPSWSAGVNGNSFDFELGSATSHLLIPNKDQIYFDENSFSISLWVKADAVSDCYFLHKGAFANDAAAGTFGKWFGIQSSGTELRFAIDDDVNKTNLSIENSLIFTNEWVNIVAVRDIVADKILIYIDGELRGETEDLTSGIGASEDLIIANSSDLNNPFLGKMDDIRIYNYALSQTEITTLQSIKVGTTNIDVAGKNNLSVYPNPMTDGAVITYTLTKAADATLSLYDLTGKEIMVLQKGFKADGTYTTSFDASLLTKGLYLLRLQTNNETTVIKIVK